MQDLIVNCATTDICSMERAIVLTAGEPAPTTPVPLAQHTTSNNISWTVGAIHANTGSDTSDTCGVTDRHQRRTPCAWKHAIPTPAPGAEETAPPVLARGAGPHTYFSTTCRRRILQPLCLTNVFPYRTLSRMPYANNYLASGLLHELP